jgi:DNA-binding protein HU-beta
MDKGLCGRESAGSFIASAAPSPARQTPSPQSAKEGIVHMTKAEFVQKVAKRAEMSQVDAGKAVQAVLDEISDTLKSGDDVQFAGFGKFSVASRAARQGVNPRSPGTKINIPARRVPKFTPGAVLKQTVDTPAKKAAAGWKKR